MKEPWEDIVLSLPQGVAVLRGEEFVFTLVNPAYQNLDSRRRFLGSTVAEAWPEVAHLIVPVLRQVVDEGVPFHANDMRLDMRRDGTLALEEAYFSFSYIPLPADGLGRKGVLATVAETTTRVKASRLAAEALREQEDELRAHFDSPAVGIAVSRVGARFVRVNDRFCAMLGYTREELLAKQWQEITHPEDLPQDLASTGRLDSGEIDSFAREKRYLRKDGSSVWALVSVSCTRDPGGKPRYIVANASDISSSKAAEEALRTAHLTVRRHLSNTPLAVIESDGLHRVVSWDGRAEAMFGWTAAEVLGKRVDEIPWVHEEDWPRIYGLLRDMRGTILPENVAVSRNRRKDGAVLTCEWYNSCLYDAEGRLASVLSLVQDVTVREEARRALAEAKERLQEVLDASADGFWDLDLTAGQFFRSARLNELFGEPAVDTRTVFAPWLDRVHPDDIAAIPSAEEINTIGKDRFDGECRVRRPDGSWHWVRSKVKVAKRNHAGKAERVTGTISDIHRAKEAEEALRRSEILYRTVAHHFPRGIVGLFDADLRMILNDGTRSTASNEPSSIVGLRPSEFIPDGEAPKVEALFRETLAGKPGHVETHHPGRIIDVFTQPVRDDHGNVILGMVMTEDTTEARAMQSQMEVNARLAALGTLVAGFAHEINNPLCAQLASHDYAHERTQRMHDELRSGRPVDVPALSAELGEVLESLDDARMAGRRAASIVRDLVSLGTPDQLRVRLGVDEIVDLAIRSLPGDLSGGATIEITREASPEVMASRGQLALVLLNLLSNALRAIPQGTKGQVKVNIGVGSPGMAVIEIKDDGVGMTPEVMNRMYDPFFTTREVQQGMGLGLPVVHAIVTAHGGRISATSAPGHGTTFRVELPLAEAAASRTPGAPA
jgi:PAS domain S-box-containing protein